MTAGFKCHCGHMDFDHRNLGDRLGECSYCACDEYDAVEDESDIDEENGEDEQ